jgi:hypothetical protein
MSIDRIKGKVAFFCDTGGCLASLETEHGDFAAARGEAKEAGWTFRLRAIWKHYCCPAHEEMDFRGQKIVGRQP